MTSLANNPQVEENYYQILEVSKTASLVEIRDAYESKLEETQLDAFAAYSLFPEDETEEILLYFSQAFVTLANPVARAKYDDELQHGMVSAEMQTVIEKEDLIKIKSLYSKKSVKKKTKTVPSAKKRSEVVGNASHELQKQPDRSLFSINGTHCQRNGGFRIQASWHCRRCKIA